MAGFSGMGFRWRGLRGIMRKNASMVGWGSLGEAEQSFLNTRHRVDLRR